MNRNKIQTKSGDSNLPCFPKKSISMCYHHLHSRTYSLNSLHSIFFPPKFLTLATTEEQRVEHPGEQFTDDTCDRVGGVLQHSCEIVANGKAK